MAKRSGKGRGWRRIVERMDRAPDYPRTVVLGLGLLLPAGLLAGGIYALVAGEVKVPDHVLHGNEATGFGVALVGLAAGFHFFVFWRSVALLRRFTRHAHLAGFLVIVAGGMIVAGVVISFL